MADRGSTLKSHHVQQAAAAASVKVTVKVTCRKVTVATGYHWQFVTARLGCPYAGPRTVFLKSKLIESNLIEVTIFHAGANCLEWNVDQSQEQFISELP